MTDFRYFPVPEGSDSLSLLHLLPPHQPLPVEEECMLAQADVTVLAPSAFQRLTYRGGSAVLILSPFISSRHVIGLFLKEAADTVGIGREDGFQIPAFSVLPPNNSAN